MSLSFKHVTSRRIGWKRDLKNCVRFGWELRDATEHTQSTTEIKYKGEWRGDNLYLKDESITREKVRVYLDFSRNSDDFENLMAVRPLEALFNLAFFIRKLLGLLLPIAYIPVIFLLAMGSGSEEFATPIINTVFIATGIWIFLMIFESIIAIIASKILRYKD